MFWDSRIDSEFRKVWQILNRFCCKVKSCLGISSQGNPDLVLNQQGNWIETQSYKVYTALLTQSGGDDIEGQYSGTLIIGRTYEILDVGDPAGDWTNVGAPNNELGTKFVATGTTPNSWGDGGGLSYNSGAPVVTVLENTIGNIWFTYNSVGQYNLNSDGLFLNNKTFCQNSLFSVEDGTGLNMLIPTKQTFSNNYVLIYTTNFPDTPSNDLLYNTPIEIRVYN